MVPDPITTNVSLLNIASDSACHNVEYKKEATSNTNTLTAPEQPETCCKSQTVKKRFIGRKNRNQSGTGTVTTNSARIQKTIPIEILNNEALRLAITSLPSNYNFEIYKSVWQISMVQPKKGILICNL